MKNDLIELKQNFSGYDWAIFGGVAVAVHYGSFIRNNSDIDIISQRELIRSNGVSDVSRRGRVRYQFITKQKTKIDILVIEKQKTVVLADGDFTFNQIITKEFGGISIPVIDYQSLVVAKERHLNEAIQKSRKGLQEKAEKDLCHLYSLSN